MLLYFVLIFIFVNIFDFLTAIQTTAILFSNHVKKELVTRRVCIHMHFESTTAVSFVLTLRTPGIMTREDFWTLTAELLARDWFRRSWWIRRFLVGVHHDCWIV